LTIPNRVREQVGLAEGDYIHIELAAVGRKVILQPAQVALRTAAEELTPAQKRRLDARLAKGLADVKAGRVHGPFATPQDTVDFLHAEVKETGAKRKPNPAAR
jgi:bifunctional DNA-binding transcriptional regulator/antitoxin component of YhaV-PrlF toxin-antitoxin module